jgi:hypothetical protein
MSPANIRSRLEKVQAELSSLEVDMRIPIKRGVAMLSEVSFEVVEASDTIDRAIKILDENYRELM